ncbi:MAG: glycine cleavage system protein GcvH [Bacteroidales bacterium]|nr:glycine cleavage system protein GcvH [Bacteroidales bacterium]
MNIPSNLFYTRDHEWIRIEGDIAWLGITEFAQDELGEIVFVEVNEMNTPLQKDDVFGSVEAVKAVSDLFMPFEGEIIAKNEDLEENPQFVNEDPYGKGWMIQIKLTQRENITEGLMDAQAYATLIQ